MNEAIKPDVLRLRFPAGIMMHDGIRNENYRVDTSGKQSSKAIPAGRGFPTPPLGDQEHTVSIGETKEEPKSVTRWILPISFGLLLMTGILALYRRRK